MKKRKCSGPVIHCYEYSPPLSIKLDRRRPFATKFLLLYPSVEIRTEYNNMLYEVLRTPMFFLDILLRISLSHTTFLTMKILLIIKFLLVMRIVWAFEWWAMIRVERILQGHRNYLQNKILWIFVKFVVWEEREIRGVWLGFLYSFSEAWDSNTREFQSEDFLKFLETPLCSGEHFV